MVGHVVVREQVVVEEVRLYPSKVGADWKPQALFCAQKFERDVAFVSGLANGEALRCCCLVMLRAVGAEAEQSKSPCRISLWFSPMARNLRVALAGTTHSPILHVFIVLCVHLILRCCMLYCTVQLILRCCMSCWVLQKEEAGRLLKQTEQQVSILKASLERATKAKEHAEAQVGVATRSVSTYILYVFRLFGG